MRQAIKLLSGLAGVLALAVSTYGCGSSTATLDPVAQAADVTAHLGGAHLALTVALEAPELTGPLTMSGQGFFNYKTAEGQISIDITGLPAGAAAKLPPGGLQLREIFKSSTIYVGSPLLAGKLPGGARWLKLDLSRFGQAIGLNLQQLAGGGSDPAQLLEYLKASGGAVRVGSEVIRSVPTTRYRATLDLRKVAQTLPTADRRQLQAAIDGLIAQTATSSIPVEAWVDANRLVRRMTMSLSFAADLAKRGHMQMTIELFDFGPTPTVTTPPDSQAFDATGAALAGVGAH